MQTKAHSLIESVANVVIGFGIAIASQILVFPMFGIHIQTHQHFAIGLCFTVISLVRSYVLRRIFNKLTGRV